MPSSDDNDLTAQEKMEFQARCAPTWRLPPLVVTPEVGRLDDLGEDEVVPFSALAHFRPRG
jgi:hypothetical protein